MALRLGTGAVIAAHGFRKLTTRFGGQGIERTARDFEDDGIRNAHLCAWAAGSLQLTGGVLTAAAVASPLGPCILTGVMIVASATRRRYGFWSMNGGWEYPAFLGLSAASLALADPGRRPVRGFDRTSVPALLASIAAGTAASRYLLDRADA